MAQEEDWADRLVNRMWDYLDRICYPNGTSQNLGERKEPLQEERQGEEETSSTPTSKGTTETL